MSEIIRHRTALGRVYAKPKREMPMWLAVLLAAAIFVVFGLVLAAAATEPQQISPTHERRGE